MSRATRERRSGGVRLCGSEHTTTEIPHKRREAGGKVYFIAQHPEGDYAIHTWQARNQNGYGGSEVTFLLEDGSYETVKGPFYGSDFWDIGNTDDLQKEYGENYKATATKIEVGKNLSYWEKGRESYWLEPSWVLGPVEDRIRACFATNTFPDDASVVIHGRSSTRHLRDDDVKAILGR